MKPKEIAKPSQKPAASLPFAICLFGIFTAVDVHAAKDGSGSPPPKAAASRADESKRGKPIDKDELLAQRRTKEIEKAKQEGKIGTLEAEFIKLMNNRSADPEADREAMRAWQKDNGASLRRERLERESARTGAKPQNNADHAKVKAHRDEQIGQAVAAGRIGGLEAEAMKRMHNHSGDPKADREALRAWQEEHGAELRNERLQKESARTGAKPQGAGDRIIAKSHRDQQLQEAVAAGRIGELEAEAMKRMHNHSGDPEADREAMRAWHEEHGEALRRERENRTAASPTLNGSEQ